MHAILLARLKGDSVKYAAAITAGARDHMVPNGTTLTVTTTGFDIVTDELHAAVAHGNMNPARMLAAHTGLV